MAAAAISLQSHNSLLVNNNIASPSVVDGGGALTANETTNGGGLTEIVAQNYRHNTNNQQDVVKLSLIIERAIQTTYHELIVLAELLPRKPDIERKVELCKWCVKTRQMFVRVFALAKWVNGTSKVDKSAHMTEFLDNQANFFVTTADRLHNMAHEDLANAKLPTFYIPHAVDVLSTGSYPRLPSAIREKVVAPQMGTQQEKQTALRKLNTLIPCVLFNADLPKEFSNYSIKNGRITFVFEDEFTVTLTLFGTDASLPWRLLDIVFLVRDDSVGEGRPLVHELQKNYLIALIQNKLNSNQFQLVDVYAYLHRFCQNLRLEIIYAQLMCLALEQRNHYIGVESYKPGIELKIYYWKDSRRQLGRSAATSATPSESSHGHSRTNPSTQTTAGAGAASGDLSSSSSMAAYSILISMDNATNTFTVTHSPKLETSEDDDTSINGGDNVLFFKDASNLKVSKLLAKTILIRSQTALQSFVHFLHTNSPTFPCTYNQSHPSVTIQVLHPIHQSETIHINVQSKTGMFVVRCDKLTHQSCVELEVAFNKESLTYKSKLELIRKQFLLDRINNSLYGLSCNIVETPNFSYSHTHPFTKLPETKVYLQIENNARYFIVVCIESEHGYVKPVYYLLQLFQPKALPNESNSQNETSSTDKKANSATMQIAALLPLDPTKCCVNYMEEPSEEDCSFDNSKVEREKVPKLNPDESPLVVATRNREETSLPGLRDVVCSCFAKFLANSVKEALISCIPGAQFVLDFSDGSPCFIITQMPDYHLGSVRASSQRAFKKLIVSIELRPRAQRNFRSVLGITFIKKCYGGGDGSSPNAAVSNNRSRSSSRTSSHLGIFLEINRWSSDNFFTVPINKLQIQWKHMLKLFDEYLIVKQYIASLTQPRDAFTSDKPWLEIVSYDCNKLVLAYGPDNHYLITFQSFLSHKSCQPIACPDMPKPRITLSNKFHPHHASMSKCGVVYSSCDASPHMGPVFDLLVNAEYNKSTTHILDLLYSLQITCCPVKLLFDLNRQVQVGVSFCNRPTDFCHSSVSIVVHNITKLSLMYRFIFVIDIEFFEDHVLMYDGAVSRFSDEITRTSPSKSDYAPQKLENFHWFLTKAPAKAPHRRHRHPNLTSSQVTECVLPNILSMSNSAMSPTHFSSSIALDTPPLQAASSTDSRFHSFLSHSITPSVDHAISMESTTSDQNHPSLTPKLTTIDQQRSLAFQSPNSKMKAHDANPDLVLQKFHSENTYLANSCFKLSYDSFNKLVEQSVVLQDSNSSKISMIELFLAWSFIKWDVVNQVPESQNYQENTLKLTGSYDVTVIFALNDNFSGLSMKFLSALKGGGDSTASSDDVTVIKDMNKQSPPIISEQDQSFLYSYFQRQIAIPPFRVPLFIAWCNFLLLPPAVISDCASILRFEVNSLPQHLWNIKVTWTAPMEHISNMTLNKIGTTYIRRVYPDSVMFLFTFESKSSGRKMDLPLDYNWKTKAVVPKIPNSVFDKFIKEAMQSLTPSSKQNSFLSSCIEYILVKMCEN